MAPIDSTTMALALALGNLALCAALFFFDHAERPAVLSSWGLSKQFQALAWLLLYLGAAGVVPDPVALPAGYLLLFAGVGWEAGAHWEAAGRAHWRRALLPALGLAAALFLLAWIVDESGLRALAAALVLGALYLAGAAARAWPWRAASMLQRFLALSCALLALVVAARGVLVLAAPGGWGWLSNAMLRQLSTAALYLLALLDGFGCLLVARERLQQELARLQVADPLTGVPNRRGFFEALAPWMALARRPGQPTALVLLDLDRFKRVNDSYGHPAGDAVLRAVADACRRQLRDSDCLGRLLGAEFAILLPRTGLAEAALVAERMRVAIEASPVKAERAMIAMTGSFGITTIRADDSAVTLFQRAGEALQAAKAAGRNRVQQAPAHAAQA